MPLDFKSNQPTATWPVYKHHRMKLFLLKTLKRLGYLFLQPTAAFTEANINSYINNSSTNSTMN